MCLGPCAEEELTQNSSLILSELRLGRIRWLTPDHHESRAPAGTGLSIKPPFPRLSQKK